MQEVTAIRLAADSDALPPPSAAPGGRADNGGKELQKIHRLLRGRYKWVQLLAAVLGAAGAYGGFRLGSKTFQSIGMVHIMPSVPKVMYSVDDKGLIQAFETFADAQAALMKSQRVTDAALDDPAWSELGRGKANAVKIEFGKHLDVVREGELISVKFTDPDPQVAMAAVNAMIKAYMNIYNELESESGGKRRDLRDALKTKQTNEWSALHEQINAIAKVYAQADLKSQFEFKQSELNKAYTRINEIQLELAAAGGSAPQTQPSSPEEIARQDLVMANLLSRRQAAAGMLNELTLQGQLEGSPKVLNAQAALKTIDDDVEKRADWFIEHPLNPQFLATGMRTATPEALQKELVQVKKLYEDLNAEVMHLGQEELRIEDLRAKEEQAKRDLDSTTSEIEKMTVEAQSPGRIQMMSEASQPLAPYRDTRLIFASAGGLGGAALSFGFFIALGLLDRRRLDRPDDTEQDRNTLVLLGTLPTLTGDATDLEQAAVAAHCVHEIRTRLQILGRAEGQNVFAVTSPEAGTGKTSLVLALGASFATAHMRTLMIDCDLVGAGLTSRVETTVRRRIGQILRRDGLVTADQLTRALEVARGSHKRIGETLVELDFLGAPELAAALAAQLEEAPLGLLDAIAGEDLTECLAATDLEGLFVLPLGSADFQHVGQLSTGSFRRVLQAARQHFDVVLIDTGPIPGSVEASLVASQADGVVLTVSRGRSRSMVDKAVSHLDTVGARMAGVVFNRAQPEDLPSYGSSSATSTRRLSVRPRIPIEEPAELIGGPGRLGPIGGAVTTAAPAIRKSWRGRRD